MAEQVDQQIDDIWDALDRGEAERALELLESIETRDAHHWIAASVAWSDLGALERAREALNQASEHLDDAADPDYLWAEGELRLREWRIEEARAVFEILEGIERNPAILERLSFCADLEGDSERADGLLNEARALSPEGHPLPPRLSDEDMDRLVAQAVERLPEDFRRSLDRVEVRVVPVPTFEIAQADPAETPPDALGLFVGASALDSLDGEAGELPPIIYVFQRNLERFAADEDELRQEIEITLYHEIGHLLGFDEEGVKAMGLE